MATWQATRETLEKFMGRVWELDYYSRPIIDEAGKKLWEVLICETQTQPCSNEPPFRYSQYCPSSTVNSVWLANAIQEAISQAPAPPNQIRFFRRQMSNMIIKAGKDLDLDAKPSRHTVALHHWFHERMQFVYPNEPGYQEAAVSNPYVQYQPLNPQRLPDALQGEKWAFVTLPAGAFAEMSEWDISFGEAFPILGDYTLVPELTPDTLIPGFIIYSSRALALAGWMSGLELAFIKANLTPPASLMLETGTNESWIIANLTNNALQTEAKSFEATKAKARNVHFIAVQSDPQSESFAGFWLLQELNLA
jgi:hypothetical protein